MSYLYVKSLKSIIIPKTLEKVIKKMRHTGWQRKKSVKNAFTAPPLKWCEWLLQVTPKHQTCAHGDLDVSKQWKVEPFTQLVYTVRSSLITHVYGKLSLYKHSLISVYIRSITVASLKHLKEVPAARYTDDIIIMHFSLSSHCQSHLVVLPSHACSW